MYIIKPGVYSFEKLIVGIICVDYSLYKLSNSQRIYNEFLELQN